MFTSSFWLPDWLDAHCLYLCTHLRRQLKVASSTYLCIYWYIKLGMHILIPTYRQPIRDMTRWQLCMRLKLLGAKPFACKRLRLSIKVCMLQAIRLHIKKQRTYIYIWMQILRKDSIPLKFSWFYAKINFYFLI